MPATMHTISPTSATHANVLHDPSQLAGRAPWGGWRWLMSVPGVAPVARVVLRAHIKRSMQKWASQYMRMALVYTGSMAVLAQAEPEIMCGPDTDAAIEGLERAERDLLAHRTQLLTMRSQLGGGFEADITALINANADAFEAAQALRWELMELQADADIAAGRVHTFASTEEAIAFLHTA